MRAAAQAGDFPGKCVGGQGTGGDNCELILVDARDLLTPDCDQRLVGDCFGNLCRECHTIHGQGVASGDRASTGDFHQQRAGSAHFFFQEPGGGVLGIGF